MFMTASEDAWLWLLMAFEWTREGNATMAMECENNAWTIFYAGRVRA